VNAREVAKLPEAIVELTGGGVDYAFECVGDVELMGQALASTHCGRRQCIVIGVAGAGEEIHARPFLLVPGRSWRGTAFGGTKGRTQLPGFVDRYMSGRIRLDELVTETAPLEAINQAYERMHAGEVIRTVICY
jgi:S-(hydroxymethyl)glutathione dehydrogenase/alcohol dehydrogenase